MKITFSTFSGDAEKSVLNTKKIKVAFEQQTIP